MRTPRDPGGYLLLSGLLLVPLGLTLPLSTLHTDQGSAETGWFGASTVLDGPDAGRPLDIPATALGWVVLIGLLGLTGAAIARARSRPSALLSLTAAAWVAVAGVSAVLGSVARAERVRSVLAPTLGLDATATGSWGPWLVVAGAAAAAGSTVFRPPPPRTATQRGVRPDGIRVWRMEA